MAAIKQEALETAQTFSKVSLYADTRIGELLRELPKAVNQHDAPQVVGAPTSTRQAERAANIDHHTAIDLQTIAANPDVVEAVIAQAEKDGRIVSRAQVLKAIKERDAALAEVAELAHSWARARQGQKTGRGGAYTASRGGICNHGRRGAQHSTGLARPGGAVASVAINPHSARIGFCSTLYMCHKNPAPLGRLPLLSRGVDATPDVASLLGGPRPLFGAAGSPTRAVPLVAGHRLGTDRGRASQGRAEAHGRA